MILNAPKRIITPSGLETQVCAINSKIITPTIWASYINIKPDGNGILLFFTKDRMYSGATDPMKHLPFISK
ncbi:hypothetical protein ACFOG5_00570 [Pedobacter fastidiosus]|uniref:Uncharacterized protein n=1 Tax=Pedobacter fastidiosus TaxID=2765361 RepID=A0ABR7KWE0_9SPHI|nr:hypothetical protein [Pedobacter fastidiosus]MBC6112013.1 hypothetical protein [Pedobacter fastidiosus]